jgi:hypothetical protein
MIPSRRYVCSRIGNASSETPTKNPACRSTSTSGNWPSIPHSTRSNRPSAGPPASHASTCLAAPSSTDPPRAETAAGNDLSGLSSATVGCSPVQLRRPTCPRPLSAGQTPKLGLEQTFVDQLVEVELHDMTRRARPSRDLVATDRFGLRRHVQIQLTSSGLYERAYAGHLRSEVISHDAPHFYRT